MTRHSPRDPSFNRIVREEIEGTAYNERILFIDTQNKIREAVYPREFYSGVLQQVRDRLEARGELKAVVHVSAVILGKKNGHGPRTSVVEYLPDKAYYAVRFQPPLATWAPDASAREVTIKLFGNEERKEEQDP